MQNRRQFLQRLAACVIVPLASQYIVSDQRTEASLTTYVSPPKIARPIPATGAQVHRLAVGQSLGRLDDRYDHIIVLPDTVWSTGLRIIGGRNRFIVGGQLSTAKGSTAPNLMIADGVAGSTTWVEGVLIDGSGGGLSDAFHLQCPNTNVDIYNCRVDGLNGSYSTTHADVIQNLGCGRLRVQRFTGRSHYNNIYMRRENDPVGNPVGPSTWRNVNFGGYTSNPNAVGTDPKHTLRGISLGTQPSPRPGDSTDPINGLLTGSVWLYNYYVANQEFGVTADQSVWPHAAKTMAANCRAEVSADGKSIDWPLWRTLTHPPHEETNPSRPGVIGSGDAKVYGIVNLSEPPSGDFVPAGSVGLSYPRMA